MRWFNDFTQTAMTLALATAVAVPAVAAEQQPAQDNQQTQSQTADEPQQQDQKQTKPKQDQKQTAKKQSEQKSEQKRDQKQTAQKQSDQSAARELRIFELEHRDPQQLAQLLSLWDQTASPAYAARAALLARQAGAVQPQGEEKVAIAMDNEKKLLFVRGSQEQIKQLETLINQIDVADDQVQAQEFANHRLIPIPNQDAGRIQSTLMQLGLSGKMIPVGETCFIAYPSDDEAKEQREQAEKVIERLTESDKKEKKSGDQEQKKSSSRKRQAADAS